MPLKAEMACDIDEWLLCALSDLKGMAYVLQVMVPAAIPQLPKPTQKKLNGVWVGRPVSIDYYYFMFLCSLLMIRPPWLLFMMPTVADWCILWSKSYEYSHF